MRVCALASGSKGNAYYVEAAGSAILIDAGLGWKDMKTRAAQCGADLKKISGVLITHEHCDHIRGVGLLTRALDVPVYCPPACRSAIVAKTGNIPLADDNPFYENGFDIGEIRVEPFRTPHDAVYSVGYRVEAEGKVLAIATDLGMMTETVRSRLCGADLTVLESNHDVDMLKKGRYPEVLKRRILSGRGHLSNADAAQTVCALVQSGTKKFILAHISEDNNLPALAFNETHEALHRLGAERDVTLKIAEQYFAGKFETL